MQIHHFCQGTSKLFPSLSLTRLSTAAEQNNDEKPLFCIIFQKERDGTIKN
jgi:hypothetical protein